VPATTLKRTVLSGTKKKGRSGARTSADTSRVKHKGGSEPSVLILKGEKGERRNIVIQKRRRC